LDAKKVKYVLKDIAADEKAKDEMKDGSGKAVVPQIFVDGKFKGVSLALVS
jgi:glutaredoxin